jgi:hypothetical protein
MSAATPRTTSILDAILILFGYVQQVILSIGRLKSGAIKTLKGWRASGNRLLLTTSTAASGSLKKSSRFVVKFLPPGTSTGFFYQEPRFFLVLCQRFQILIFGVSIDGAVSRKECQLEKISSFSLCKITAYR